MSFIIGSSSGHIDFSNDILAAVTGTSLQTVDSIAAGGTGYSVGNVLTLSGGTSTIAATVEVTTVSSGAVTGVRITNAGVYSAAPGDPVSTTGVGSGCTLNCTFGTNGWTTQRDTTYSGSEREVILLGSGDGGDEIFVGWRTFSSVPGDYYNLELHGMTGFTTALPFAEQPGLSPGLWDAGLPSDKAGPYTPLSSSSLTWWLSVTPYWIFATIRVGSNYYKMFLGWANRFATETEYPYPLMISGDTSLFSSRAGQSELMSGLTDPFRANVTDGSARGPLLLRTVDGTWYDIKNSIISTGARTYNGDRCVMPAGRPVGTTSGTTPNEDKFMTSTGAFTDFIPEGVISGGEAASLQPTPNSGDTTILFPCVVVFSVPVSGVMVEIPNTYWVSGFGAIVSEDRVIVDGVAYRVFQNGNRTDNYAYLAMRES